MPSIKSPIATGRISSFFLLLFSLTGLLASFELLQSELKILGDPNAALGCNINPLISCSNSLLADQAHLFGTSNSLIGLGFFVALLTLSVLLLSGVNLPRWIWVGLSIGTVVGIAYVIYFLTLSVTVFKALCPFCLLVWAAVLGVSVIVWATVIGGGLFGQSFKPVGRSMTRYSGLLILALYLLIALVVLVLLRDRVAMVFV